MTALYEVKTDTAVIQLRIPAFWLDDMASKVLITDKDSLNVTGHNIAAALVVIIREALYPKWQRNKTVAKPPDYCDAP